MMLENCASGSLFAMLVYARMGMIRFIIRSLEQSNTTFGLWLVSFSSLIAARITIELGLFGFERHSGIFLWYEWTHTFLFFLLSFLLFLPMVRFFARVPLSSASNVLLFGFLIILSPPVIDFILSDGAGFWSFYAFDGFPGLVGRYFTFFGDHPDMGITYGVRFEVAIVSILFGVYVFLKTHRALRSASATLSAYTLLFFLGTFPSWAAILIEGISEERFLLRASHVAGIFLSPLSLFSRDEVDLRSILNAKMSLVYGTLLPFVTGLWLFSHQPKLFRALFRNARLPQIFYHSGLLMCGMGLSLLFSNADFPRGLFEVLSVIVLLFAVVSAWLASVVVNDFFDTSIDIRTNPTRPLPSGTIPPALYSSIGIAFFGVSMLFSGLVSLRSALFLVAYQAIAFLYSAPPFRLKRFPGMASLASGFASLLILILGFTTFAPDGSVRDMPFSFLALFLCAYAVSIPLKDFKDIPGDREDGVFTLPVIWGVERAKLLVGSGIFLSYMASIWVFSLSSLFLPALLLGSASFWTIFSMREKTGRITYRSVFWWILGFVSIYSALVAGAVW